MTLLRVVGVDYLNARPLWQSLRDDERVELTLARPSDVARRIVALVEKANQLPNGARIAATEGGV